MIEIKQYTNPDKKMWDDFVTTSKNGNFLFYRDYMEYHADRFSDLSLIIYRNKNPIALIPGNYRDDVFYSHEGLTFGGVVSAPTMKLSYMVDIFFALKQFLKEHSISVCIYKAIPHMYHTYPSEEDLYVLFRLNAQLIRRDVSSVINLSKPDTISKNRRKKIQKNRKSEITVNRSFDFCSFMEIVQDNLLSKYGVRPTHSTDEITNLAKIFPDYIQLYSAEYNSKIIAGIIVYLSPPAVIHCQYTHADETGKQHGASDLIIEYLMRKYSSGFNFLDFGISTEREGQVLNNNLLSYKESFGASAGVYDQYKILI